MLCRTNIKSVKLVFFTPGLNIGGIERVFVNYSNIMARHGYDVTFLCCHRGGAFEELLDSRVHYVNLRTDDLKRSVGAIVRFFRRNHPDYIFTANVATLVVLVAKMMSLSKVRVVASHHNYDNVENRGFMNRLILWNVYNHCHKIIGISEGITELLINHGVKKSKIVTIRNPIDIDEVERKSKETFERPARAYILFVGRIAAVKNLRRLVDAYRLARSGDIKLVILGEGPDEEDLKRYCADIGLEHEVLFLGKKINPFPYIAHADVVALSSDSEAYPTVILESLVLGKTFVSTPTKGALEILRFGRLGYISDDFTHVAYAEAMRRGMHSPIDARALQWRAREYYSPEVAIEKMERQILHSHQE